MAQPGSPDQKLVQSAAQGNRKAFRELFNRYFQAVYNYALTLSHDPALAEDITQEAFIRAHKNLHRLGPPWNFHAWIFKLARNYFIDQTRKERELDELEEERQVISPGPTPETTTISRETSRRVHSTLDRLPGRQREILVLRELRGFSYAEIGEIMDLSSSNVKVSLHRARAAFQESYGIGLLLEDPSGDCLEVSELLESLHDGENLSDRERFVKEHLKVCKVCQKRRDLLVKQSAILGAFVPIMPPKDLAGRILDQIPGSAAGPAISKGGKIARILGYGGMAGMIGVTAVLAYNLFSTGKFLPNFPPAAGPTSTPEVLAQFAPTPTEAVVEPPLPPSSPTPTLTPTPKTESEHCDLFEEKEISLVLLSIREGTLNVPIYLKIGGGVPGGESEEGGGETLWQYTAWLGDIPSYKCDLQGFEDRLYCMFTLTPDMPGTEQWFSLTLEGCQEPVYSQAVILPEAPVADQEQPVSCHAGLYAKSCIAARGEYKKINDTDYLCFCPR